MFVLLDPKENRATVAGADATDPSDTAGKEASEGDGDCKGPGELALGSLTELSVPNPDMLQSCEHLRHE